MSKLSRTRLHVIWRGMKNRCNNSNNKSFKNYGERGITIFNDMKIFKMRISPEKMLKTHIEIIDF